MINGYIIENNLSSGTAVFDTHLHDKYEINFMLTDNIEVIIEDKFYISKCGDVFIFPPFTFHKIDSNKLPFSRFLMFFDEYSILSSASSLSPAISLLKSNKTPVVHLDNYKADKLLGLFEKAYNAQHMPSIFEDFKNIALFGNILCYILENAESPYSEDSYYSAGKISKILTYVNNNISENLSVEKIAGQFNISTTTLWHMMRSSLGITLKEYITKIRIAKAMELLHKGLSVTEVSNRSGFNSYAHFIRTFKKSVGTPPHKYAKNLKLKEK